MNNTHIHIHRQKGESECLVLIEEAFDGLSSVYTLQQHLRAVRGRGREREAQAAVRSRTTKIHQHQNFTPRSSEASFENGKERAGKKAVEV